jgi:mRNA-degrading endonuclease RelE of RelBE toxin-antitoxin system
MPLWRYRVGNYRIVYSAANEAQLIVVERIERRTTGTYENLP